MALELNTERIEAAILRTALYADVFDFAMTIAEIHHFLICESPVPPEHIQRAFEQSPRLRQKLTVSDGYVALAGREAAIEIRRAREHASRHLWSQALHYGRWLARLPFVRMIALTGALAMRNAADDDDDIDYLIVTQPGRVWLARAFAIVLVRRAALRGVTLCPNYVLAADALEQDPRNLFIAHEITQMVPLYGHDLYQDMIAANRWVADFLPNATRAFQSGHDFAPSRGWTLFKRGLEILLGGWPGSLLEGWEYRRKLRRFAPDMHNPGSAALLDERQVRGYFDDHGGHILRAYQERLAQYGLGEAPVPAADAPRLSRP